MIATMALTASCTRHVRTERMMTWSEESRVGGMTVPHGESIMVLRFADDPGQGVTVDSSPGLRGELTRLGNPVLVSFDCWRRYDGTFGFNIIGIGGEPYVSGVSAGPSRAGAFSEGPSLPNPLESAVPR